MNWKIRLYAKILGGRFSALRGLFRGLGYLRLGNMVSPEYAAGVFDRHFKQDPAPTSRAGGTCLELGPGESLLSMMLARAAGFERTILVDQGRHIGADTSVYAAFSRALRARGHDVPEIRPDASLEDVLRAYSAVYLTEGLKSLESLETGSVAFSFSQAVLEHVPKAAAGAILRQLRRATAPGGFSSHHVDLKDHLGGGLNHLRFPESWWEREAVRRSGIYTNRLRYPHWLELFREAGLDYRVVKRADFPVLPLPRAALAPEFRDLPEDDLRAQGFQVVFTGSRA